MINEKIIIFLDFETGSLNPYKTQPLELAAVAICPRKLEIIEGSEFYSKIKPLSDKEAEKKGLDIVQKSALDVNKLDLKELKKWPTEKVVFDNFVNYLYQFNPKKDSWNAPIAAHFNGRKFDMIINERLCKEYKYFDEKKNQQKIFNPIQDIDLKDIMWMLNENNPDIDYNNMDAIRKWLNMSTEHSHEALQDVIDGAKILCRCMKYLRFWSSKTTFK